MSEFVLFLVIVALCGLIGWIDYNNRKERQKLIQAIMSKTAQDLKDFELADKISFESPKMPDIPPEFEEVNELSDEDFDKHIIKGQQ